MKSLYFSLSILFFSQILLAEKLLPVPIVRQATDYSCGPASLLSILNYWKAFDGGEAELYLPLKTTQADGTDPIHIKNHLVEMGFEVILKENTSIEDLKTSLGKERPVLVDYQAWSEQKNIDYKNTWENGHYSVVVGMDPDWIYFMDPVLSHSYGKLSYQEFLDRWHDYETRNGKIEKNYQLAIFINGSKKITQYPSEIKKIE